MKTMILSLMAFLCCGTLFASTHPAPGRSAVSAEYLYFMPSIDDTYFVIKSLSSNPPVNGNFRAIGKRENNDFDFNPGYRIAGAYAFCSCERAVELTYTHFNASQSRTVSDGFLSGTVGGGTFLTDSLIAASNGQVFQNYFGTASSKLNANYKRVDGLLWQGIFNCCNSDIFLLFGAEYAYLHLNEYYTFNNPTLGIVGNNNQTSHIWGVGPELGVSVDHTFLDCTAGKLSLIVKSTASLLASKATASMFSATVNSAGTIKTYANFHDKNSWRIIPAFHARLGVGYDVCVCNFETALEIGYEFNSYYRGFGRTYMTDDISSETVTEYTNYDLQGLYVSASIGF